MDLLRNFFKGDKIVWIIYLTLCLISVIEVFSASSTLIYKSGNHWAPITGHLTALMIGAVVVWITHNIPSKVLKVGILLYPISIILLGIVLGTAAINGASRWIPIGSFQFQPSELAKMATIISAAFTLSYKQENGYANKKAIRYILLLTGLTCLLIVSENLSTALLLTISIFLMMIIGKVPTRQLLNLTGAGIILLAIGISTIKYIPANTWENIGIHRMATWQNRLDSHFDTTQVPPEKFDTDANAQVAHANIAIASSHIIGKGPGNSVQRDFLSQAFSDFIYAIIIEELGLVGGAAVAFLYICLLIRIGKIARNCDKPYYSYLIMGFGFIMVSQALFNMMVAVGLMPVTGQPLPLISKGGTAILVNSAYFGIILSISRYVDDVRKREQQAIESTGQPETENTSIVQQADQITISPS